MITPIEKALSKRMALVRETVIMSKHLYSTCKIYDEGMP